MDAKRLSIGTWQRHVMKLKLGLGFAVREAKKEEVLRGEKLVFSFFGFPHRVTKITKSYKKNLQKAKIDLQLKMKVRAWMTILSK